MRHMTAEEFVKRMGLAAEHDDMHFVFWIGAGCSISSGIPSAGSLTRDRWLPKLQQIRGGDGQSLVEWAKEIFPEYDHNDPGTHYGAVMEELFIHPEARQREIEALCDRKYPGFGYAVLAALLARTDGLFNVALTTNFDDLIADAMYLFTEARPLVIPDEALAGYIRPTRMRPLVVKIHGDHRLSPRNTQTETATLKQGISEGIHDLLHDRGVIFIGYGGYDSGIAEVLNSLPRQALPLGVWWVNPAKPTGVLASWLSARNAIWVETRGFDELMLLFRDQFGIEPPNSAKFDRVFEEYLKTYRDLSGRVERIPDSDPEATSLKHAAQRAERADVGDASSWSSVWLQASRLAESNPVAAEKLYRDGMKQFPDAQMIAFDLANFLLDDSRPNEAIEVTESALQAMPRNAYLLALRGQAQMRLGMLDKSLGSFEKALEIEPKEIQIRSTYGMTLVSAGRVEDAESEAERCLQDLGDQGTMNVGVLLDRLGRYETANELHRRALVKDPENPNIHGNLALNLIALHRLDEARAEIERSLECADARKSPVVVEVLFYRFVLDPEDNDALARLAQMLDEGGRSFGWDFSIVVKYGKTIDHPDVIWLESLADVINGSEPLESLEPWERWRKLS